MTTSATIRLAGEYDAAQIAEIYRPFCESSVVSFEYTAPSLDEMASRLRVITGQFPWLVLDDGGRVIGYAYASRHSERAAYGWSVNTAVYVRQTHHRRGVGRALYTSLFELLVAQGYYKAYAGITLPNAGSTGLHESFGFTRTNPDPPRPIASVLATDAAASAFVRGIRHFRTTE
jgi:phosphinothricin acetyltransferase